MTETPYIVGAGGCWCGFSTEMFKRPNGLTHPEAAGLFAGIRRHAGRLSCGHVQPFLRAPQVGDGEWCQRCRRFRWVETSCGCPRFADPPAADRDRGGPP